MRNEQNVITCFEPVEPGDNQLVTGPEKRQHGRKLDAALAAAARHLFGANDRAALGFELRELQVEVLVDGADAGVTDAGQGCHLEV